MQFPAARFNIRQALPLLSALLLLLLCIPPAHAGPNDIPPNAPPDIKRILQKMIAGQTPTQAEMKRLEAWGKTQGVNTDAPPTPPAAVKKPTEADADAYNRLHDAAQGGISCRVSVTQNYTRTDKNHAAKVTFSMTAWADALLFPKMRGTGDYAALGPNGNIPASTFRVASIGPGTATLKKSGGGSMTVVVNNLDHEDVSRTDGQFTSGDVSFLLATTGKGDALYPVNGQGAIGGHFTGRTEWHDAFNHNTTSVDTDSPGGLVGLFPQEAQQNYQFGAPSPMPRLNLSYRALAQAVKSPGAATVSGSEGFTVTDKEGYTYTGQTSLRITLRPTRVELRIEPDDAAAYNRWLPAPKDDGSGSPPTFYGDASPLAVHVVMVDPGKAGAAGGKTGRTKPNVDHGGQIDVYLRDVSQLKGVCMNFPAKGDTQDDLFFPEQQPPGIKYIDPKHVQTKSATAVEATVWVAARDTAAYGAVHAECQELGLEGRVARTGKSSFSVPLDENENHIADGWEKTAGIYGKHLPPDWDGETKPEGMLTKGDGLTLFEEYRGFRVEDGSGAERFLRPSPERRKLFLYLDAPDKSLHKQGADLYGRVTGITPIYVHQPERMQQAGKTKHPNWINFNETPFTKAQQRAVWIIDRTDEAPGIANNFDDYPDQYNFYPDTIDDINVSRKACTGLVELWQSLLPPQTAATGTPQEFDEAAAKNNLDLKQIGATLPARKSLLIDNLIVFVTLHELGHATGARHHGIDEYAATAPLNKGGNIDPQKATQAESEAYQAKYFSSGDHACPMRYWHYDPDRTEILLFLAGKWDLVTGPAQGGAWKFCPTDWKSMAIAEGNGK